MISTISVKIYLAAEFQQPKSRKHRKRTLPAPKKSIIHLDRYDTISVHNGYSIIK